MAGKRYTFVLNFGYAENSMLSFMPWVSVNTFKDAKDALVDLAIYLKEKFLLDNEAEPKKCCNVTVTKDPSASYCSKCGKFLSDKQFDPENFENWLRELSTDIDTFMGMCEDWETDARWEAGHLDGSPNQRFVYQAEWVLSAALGHPHHDRTFEEVCKARTKNKRDSFSYY